MMALYQRKPIWRNYTRTLSDFASPWGNGIMFHRGGERVTIENPVIERKNLYA